MAIAQLIWKIERGSVEVLSSRLGLANIDIWTLTTDIARYYKVVAVTVANEGKWLRGMLMTTH
jgi:hypothetical protein